MGPGASTPERPDSTPPGTPANLSAQPNGPGRIDLVWSASSDDTGVQAYRVYRDGVLIATTASTSYADSGLAPAASPSSYTYDGDGLRLSASVDGTSTSFVWDPNASLRDYTYGLGLTPISLTTPSASSYYHADATGSVLAVSSASGDAQWSYSYDPFGAALSSQQLDPTAPEF